MRWRSPILAAMALPFVASCSSSNSGTKAPGAGGHGASNREAGATSGGAANAGSGGLGAGGTSGHPSHDAGVCNENRPEGVSIDSGTLSFDLDGVSESGGGQILWDGQLNHVSLASADGSTLTIVFPGCAPAAYSLPPTTARISMTYVDAMTGSSWTCSYLDPSLPDATCSITVTAYGASSGAPVSGTFAGTLVKTQGDAPATTRAITGGMFFMQRP